MTRLRPAAAVLALGLLALPTQAKPAEPVVLQGQARVIDGDTLVLEGARIRLHGIDAPELRQRCEADDGTVWPCGRHAAAMLAAMTEAAQLTCEGRRQDRYRRLVAICAASGLDVAAQMVADGLAVAARRYSRAYLAVEEEARLHGRGVWSGRFDRPSDWRAVRHRAGHRAAPEKPI
ncbi:thermonuclease family protein [Roseomonas sp. AR75]|uniref:thermonuclease family protein n=1 Tax=Roseomonas sp. AR75 TaxID=2562311 RepID=UPI0014854BD4|nr:thermonuclease family protein [Roseomonas sp. AR75]